MAASYNELFGLGTHSQDANLEGYWRLQESSGTSVSDSSGKGRTGTVTNAINIPTTTGPNAWLPNAFDPDGINDFIDIASAAGLTAFPFTLAAFVRPDATTDSFTPISLHANGVSDQYMHLEQRSGKYSLVARNTSFTNVTSTTNINTGAFVHQCGVYESNTSKKLYINGSLEATLTTSVTLPTVNRIYIGKLRQTDNAGIYDGKIAGVCAFSRALTQAEIDEARLGPEPLNTAAPSITGSTTVGSLLTCSTGSWNAQSNGTLSYTYQWKNAGSNISGATSSTYTIQSGDTSITCVVRASNDGGYDSAQDTTSSNTVTVTSGSQTIALGVATETDSAPSLTVSNPRSYALGVATETDSVPSLAVNNPRSYALGVATETDSANALTITNPRSYSLGVAQETDTANGLTVGVGQTIALGVATETDSAPSITVTNPRSYALGVATEVNAALALSILNPRSYSLGVATETDAALGLTVSGGSAPTSTNLILSSYSTVRAS